MGSVELNPIDFLNNTPKVLLFGNGLSRNAGGMSTDKIIKKLWKNDKINESEIEQEQFPIKIIISTEDNVDKACGEISKIMNDERFYRDKDLSLFNKYLNLNFDAFLTTNYSYEAEYSLDPNFKKHMAKYAVHTAKVAKRESKYLIHSFYRLSNYNSTCDIWHIHGEAKNKESLVIGQFYYGNLLGRYIKYLEKAKRYNTVRKNEIYKAYSWLDYFIFSDVYIVGLNLGFSEYDLWWLLNRKKREKYRHGKTYYFKSKKDNISKALQAMLELYEVEIINDESNSDPNSQNYYDTFYKWVYEYLRKETEEK